jgi:outer membrane immunogenic protein
MRRFVIALLGATAMGAAANAADLPVKAPPYQPPPPYNWTGIYIGGFAGGLWAHKDWTFVTGVGDNSHTADGFFGGGQIGINYQFYTNWVIGAQFDWGWTNADGSADCTGGVTCTTKVKDLGSVTGRLGYAWDNWLLYAKGGGAWVKDDYDTSGAGVFTGSATPGGWTVGGGLEWGFLPNWSLFAEYDYYDFGTKRISFNDTAGTHDDFDAKQTVSVAKVGVNYRFNWLRP